MPAQCDRAKIQPVPSPVHENPRSPADSYFLGHTATLQAPIFPNALTRSPQRLPDQELDRQLEYDLAVSHILSTPRTTVPEDVHLKRAGAVPGKPTSLHPLAPG
jgi:hypothetical protein